MRTEISSISYEAMKRKP